MLNASKIVLKICTKLEIIKLIILIAPRLCLKVSLHLNTFAFKLNNFCSVLLFRMQLVFLQKYLAKCKSICTVLGIGYFCQWKSLKGKIFKQNEDLFCFFTSLPSLAA